MVAAITKSEATGRFIFATFYWQLCCKKHQLDICTVCVYMCNPVAWGNHTHISKCAHALPSVWTRLDHLSGTSAVSKNPRKARGVSATLSSVMSTWSQFSSSQFKLMKKVITDISTVIVALGETGNALQRLLGCSVKIYSNNQILKM